VLKAKPKQSTPLQKLKKAQRPKLTPLPTLIKRADTAFSRYVRLRDAAYSRGAFRGECITCGRKLEVCRFDGKDWKWNAAANIGHYITRGHKGLRFDERNCNLQCARCNAWEDKVKMITSYTRNLDLKYGDGVATELQMAGREAYKLTRGELETIIRDSKEYVAWTLAHPEGLYERVG
jgi:hypothetical protein